MDRPAEVRARKLADRMPLLWRRRGWVDPEVVWILDRVAPARIGDRRTEAASCIVVAAIVPAWNGSGYRLTATPCDPTRR